MVVKFDHVNQKVRASLRAVDILNELNSKEHNDHSKRTSVWNPEFASYMVEGTPGKPYGVVQASGFGLLSYFNFVEANMKERREEVQKILEKDEALLCITSFPRYFSK